MQSYVKSLHTAEPLIAHLLNPNYLQVMIIDLKIFSLNVLTESVSPLDDLIPAYWAVGCTHA